MLQNQNTILTIFDIRNSSNQQDSTNRCSYHLFHLQMQQLNHVIRNGGGYCKMTSWNRQQHYYHQHQKNCAIGYFASKKGCGSSCGCRKLGLQCSSVCGECNGQACLNASSYPDDLKEESEYARI
jgi:hypothetical protein